MEGGGGGQVWGNSDTYLEAYGKKGEYWRVVARGLRVFLKVFFNFLNFFSFFLFMFVLVTSLSLFVHRPTKKKFKDLSHSASSMKCVCVCVLDFVLSQFCIFTLDRSIRIYLASISCKLNLYPFIGLSIPSFWARLVQHWEGKDTMT